MRPDVLGSKRGPHAFVWPAYVLFFVILYLPVTQNYLRGGLIAIVVGIIFLNYLFCGRGVRIHRTVLSWTLFYSVVGIGYVILGLIRGAPGALFSLYIYVLCPLLYALFIAAATSAKIWINLIKIMAFATIAIGLATFEYVFWAIGWIPDSLHVDLGLVDSIVLYEGYVQMYHYSLASLIFLVPFLIAALLVYNDRSPPFVSRKLLWMASLLGIAVVLLGGRRALLLIVALAPLLILFFRAQLPDRIKAEGRAQFWRALLGVFVLAICTGTYLSRVVDLSWHGLVELVFQGFDFDVGGAFERQVQFFALLQGWLAHPLFGNGLGSFTTESIRSDRPWEYELQYVLLLFQTGLVGVILYSSGIFWLFRTGLKVVRSPSPIGKHMVPVLVGTSSFLIANATNPYLQTFGHLWTIFLPIGLINWWLLSNERAPVKKHLLGSLPG